MIKILIIDDDDATRKYLAKCLEKYSCQVFLADSGDKGVELVNKVHPDIVLLDYRMDSLNGIQTLKEIIKINPAIKVNMVTMERSRAVETEALEAGARSYIHKPINLDDLASLIIKQMHEN